MFNIGPMELGVLALVGLIVLGPDKLPDLARDAARMIRTLREMATGARQQLKEELGPEFADLDLRSLHPRTVVQRAVLGDMDVTSLDPRRAMQQAFSETPEDKPVTLQKPVGQQPLARNEAAPYDADAT
jgi:sec-independent protein translocase protein TatB